MTNQPRTFVASCICALALLASCQNTQKAEEKPVEPATASQTTTAPETKVVMTAVPVESSKASASQPATQKSATSKKSGSSGQSMPVSSPSSDYTAERLRDMEKGLRRLQSLPSGKAKSSKSSRNKRDI